MSASYSLKKKLRFPVIEKVSGRKEEGFVFHLYQPASALHPCNRTPPRWAGTCRRKKVDTFHRQKKGQRHKKKNNNLETHTLLISVPAVRSRTSSVTSRFGGICWCCWKHLEFQDIFNHEADCASLWWQKRPLPLCETPSLYRAAWCKDPPAAHICHGGCPEHRPERIEPKNTSWELFSQN